MALPQGLKKFITVWGSGPMVAVHHKGNWSITQKVCPSYGRILEERHGRKFT